MQSPFTVTNRTAGKVTRSARAIVLGTVFVLLAFSNTAAQPLTDSHRGRDLPSGHAVYSSWDIIKEGHRYQFLLADGIIKDDAAPAIERRHRYYA